MEKVWFSSFRSCIRIATKYAIFISDSIGCINYWKASYQSAFYIYSGKLFHTSVTRIRSDISAYRNPVREQFILKLIILSDFFSFLNLLLKLAMTDFSPADKIYLFHYLVFPNRETEPFVRRFSTFSYQFSFKIKNVIKNFAEIYIEIRRFCLHTIVSTTKKIVIQYKININSPFPFLEKLVEYSSEIGFIPYINISLKVFTNDEEKI